MFKKISIICLGFWAIASVRSERAFAQDNHEKSLELIENDAKSLSEVMLKSAKDLGDQPAKLPAGLCRYTNRATQEQVVYFATQDEAFEISCRDELDDAAAKHPVCTVTLDPQSSKNGISQITAGHNSGNNEESYFVRFTSASDSEVIYKKILERNSPFMSSYVYVIKGDGTRSAQPLLKISCGYQRSFHISCQATAIIK